MENKYIFEIKSERRQSQFNDAERALEKGQILHISSPDEVLPSGDDQQFLREILPRAISLKNVSYYYEDSTLRGMKGTEELKTRAAIILKTHIESVREALGELAPDLTKNMRLATCSFRPLEERGRNLSQRASNELLHFDAKAYGATHGDRILRFFVNIHPEKVRKWRTRGSLKELYPELIDSLGLPEKGFGGFIEEGLLNRVYSTCLRFGSQFVKGIRHTLDFSPYDSKMRLIHNAMKESEAFQGKSPQYEVSFSPMTAWCVFTDSLSHACVSGQYCLVSTFIVPRKNCLNTENVPFEILKFGVGKRAASE
jgi:hypothetical protein